jgi:uncharacterized protein YbjT (DUF2867 family)
MPEGPIAIAGATGYIGRLLARCLRGEGQEVRALARTPEKARDLAEAGCDVRRADVLDRASLEPALDGAAVVYHLVHSMGRGSGDTGFASRDRQGAANLAAAAAAGSARRIVYLGGLGEGSEHLASRHETAEVLGAGTVPLAYFRAAAVIGAGSESFRTVYYLVRRLPAMVTPRWVGIRTQPVAIADVLDYLAAAVSMGPEVEREIQIGCPGVTTYGGMMDEVARAMGKRPRPRVSVPLLSPRLSSLWLGLITPVDTGVARPLVEGLTHETVVTDPSGMELFEIVPTSLEQAMAEAIAELRGERDPAVAGS